jgi:predicted GNAT family acetyltransferase
MEHTAAARLSFSTRTADRRVNVEHEPDHHRFVVRLPTGDGKLFYKVAGPGILSYWHTEVDPHLRGQGVGDALVRAAMDFARQSGQKVIPDCPFVTIWLKKHPEYQDVVAAGPGSSG